MSFEIHRLSRVSAPSDLRLVLPAFFHIWSREKAHKHKVKARLGRFVEEIQTERSGDMGWGGGASIKSGRQDAKPAESVLLEAK